MAKPMPPLPEEALEHEFRRQERALRALRDGGIASAVGNDESYFRLFEALPRADVGVPSGLAGDTVALVEAHARSSRELATFRRIAYSAFIATAGLLLLACLVFVGLPQLLQALRLMLAGPAPWILLLLALAAGSTGLMRAFDRQARN